MVMSITFEDKERKRRWTYTNVTDIHFNEKFVDVKVEDKYGIFFFRIFNYEYKECFISFE